MRTEPASSPVVAQQVLAEQIQVLFRNTPATLSTNVLLATAVAWSLRHLADHALLWGWWGTLLLITLVRAAVVLAYRHRDTEGDEAPWRYVLTSATLCSGLIWGLAGWFFFFPQSVLALIFLTVILAGLAAGSIPAYASWPPAQYSVIPTVLPMACRFMVEGGDFFIMGLICVLYLANILLGARQISKVLIRSIRLQLEKQELVQQLMAEKQVAEEARSRAEDANLAKSKFLAAASHDLRQPLHAVGLFVEALRHERDPVRAQQVVEYLGTSAQSLEELLNALLEISKLEAGLFEPQRQVLAVQDLFDALEQELWPIAQDKGIRLNFATTRLHTYSDAQMLGRILRNLIINAIHHTERGRVLVGCRQQQGRVALVVYDTGPGIPAQYHQAIFREFYQLSNPERDQRKGLGLGLAIVRGLCRVLDHPITLRSCVGRGSAFWVSVPMVQPALPLPLATAPDGDTPVLQCTVLVIDDEPAIRQAMTDVLARWGCMVWTAASAQEAVALLQQQAHAPDMVLADYRLQAGHTGSEAIAAVRQALRLPIPAAILTGDTAPERLREASASGFLLLHKPVQPAKLRAVLHSLYAMRLPT
ncbi:MULTISPECIES: ATP-binding response regulator [Giesbergeria]|uniref:histidine kinase n=1 Tax=Giesbergeria sinuosa TaxID=80883 RepID=A0ABV9QFH6_9BURK